MDFAVDVRDISKSYGRVQALSGVSFAVERGEIFGIIGADGAGKTTLFRILTTLLLADQGTATVDGFDVVKGLKEIRKRVGYMPGRFSLYQDLTIEENLNFYATLFGTTVKENYHLIEDIYSQIEPFKTRPAGKLSGGMKQKLALSCALIHRPTVLFLDEPTTGIDPVSRKEFWAMLARLRNEGITILVSTPYMDEALQCTRIGLISKGEFLSIDTPTAIVGQFDRPIFAVSGGNMPALLRLLRTYSDVYSCFAFGDVHHVVFNTEPDLWRFSSFLRENGYPDAHIHRIDPSIEDCFMNLLALQNDDR